MKLFDALCAMGNENRIQAVRLPSLVARRRGQSAEIRPEFIITRETMEGKGNPHLCLSADLIGRDTWEIGWTCENCWGTGEVMITCPRCKGSGMYGGEICCGGTDSKDCPGEEGKPCTGGIYWTPDY